MLEEGNKEAEPKGPPDIVYDFEYAQVPPDEDPVEFLKLEESLER